MAREAEKRWLSTAVTATLFVAVAAALPWFVIKGNFSASGNGFSSNANLFGMSSPNWVVLAASVIVTAYATMQYLGVAGRRSLIPLLLSMGAVVQTSFVLYTVLFGEPTQQTNVSGFPVDRFPGFEKALGESLMGSSPDIQMGIGLPITFACAVWLLISSVLFLIGSKDRQLESAGADESALTTSPS